MLHAAKRVRLRGRLSSNVRPQNTSVRGSPCSNAPDGGRLGSPRKALSMPIYARTDLLLLCLLQGCVVVPRTTTSYDRECQVVSRRVTLEPVQIAALGGCRNADCGALLVFAGVTAAGSAVISGSIAVVGNVVYWLEEKGQCQRQGPTPQPAPTASSAT